MRRAVALVLAACASTPPSVVPTSHAAPPPPAPPAATWAEDTHSPRPATTTPDSHFVEEALAACGDADEALTRAAPNAPVADTQTPALRELGVPYMNASYMGAANVEGDDRVMPELTAMLKSLRTPYSRCGITMEGPDLNIVRAEVLADLAPLPIRSRTGAWLTFDAIVHAPVTSPRVVVVGPRGVPKTFPTTLDARGHARARFVLDHPGAFEVQLIADVEDDGYGHHEGNRSLAEALVFADVEPSHTIEAPGEHEPSLEAMIAAVRKLEGLAPLTRDARLDALAAAHAAKMAKDGRVWHDLGDGDFAKRFQAEGHSASVVGENIARAGSLALAHRALWKSPSHRLNLLHDAYTHVGLAIVTRGKETWVCETFASNLR